jgi:hypothetical protein
MNGWIVRSGFRERYEPTQRADSKIPDDDFVRRSSSCQVAVAVVH